MGEYWEAVPAVLCVIGLALVCCWLVGLLLRPLPGRAARVILTGRGGGEDLEQLVWSFIWLRGMGLLRCPIVIADAGLNPDGWELALRLAARWPDVVLWPVSDLPDYITRT